MMKLKVALLLVAVAVWSCALTPYEGSQKLKVGLDKDEVLELMGSPNTSDRKNGLDEWVYVFYHEKKEYRKLLVFENGLLKSFADDLRDTPEMKALQKAENMQQYEKAAKKVKLPPPPKDETTVDFTQSN